MFGFRPTSSSSPAKPLALTGPSSMAHTTVSNTSRTSARSSFSDAVMLRISPNATSFLSGLKAYNDELHERGLDSQTETVHYGRLLEICKLRGPSWQVKWDGVKKQYGYRTAPSAAPQPIRSAACLTTPVRDDDDDDHDEAQTTSETEQTEESREEHSSDTERDEQLAPYGVTMRDCLRQPQGTTSLARLSSIPGSRVMNLILPTSLTRQATPRPQSTYQDAIRRVPAWEGTSDTTDDAVPCPSTTPPSYRAAVRAAPTSKPAAADIRNQILPRAPSPIKLPKPEPPIQAILPQSRERKGSVINEEDAWKKIKMARDEEDAAKFREDKLLERCWEIWLLGYQWLITTNQQVAGARDNVILGSTLRRWRNATATLLERQEHVATLANTRRLRAAMAMWKAGLKEKQQIAWRNDMRAKMKTVRGKRELSIQKDAWAKWRQSFRSHLSELQYSERIVMRSFLRWKTTLSQIRRLEATAYQFHRRTNSSDAILAWKRWKRMVAIRNAEKVVRSNVGLRVKCEVIQVWKKHTHDRQAAAGFYDVYVMKQVIRSWKAACDRIREMERRADKHLARQDDVLVRAVNRVWKARERGKLLERVRSLRLIKSAWSAWMERMRQHRHLEGEFRGLDYALAFSMRSNSYTVSSALQTWHQVYGIYQNRRAFAVQRHLARIQYDALLKWRIQLRSRLKLIKHAKFRRTLKIWKLKLAEKKRQNKLKSLEARKLQECIRIWQQKANRRRWLRTAEHEIATRLHMRLVANALSLWTNRVIEVKLRELEVSQKNAQALLTFAFRKWKNICLRHVEDLSLMESHLDIKQAENMRRMFHKWLAAARARHHKRLLLRERQAEFDRASMQVAWDRWREKYVEDKLRPIAHQVAMQSQKNILFRAFGIWHAKTRSLPAIRFRASRIKTKFWEVWRAAMPQALQAKKARERHTLTVLTRAFEKWNHTYKKKRHLKEIARARYLRLPSVSPGQSIATPKPAGPLVPKATRNAFPRRNVCAETETEDSEAGPSGPTVRSSALTPRPGIASLLSSRPRVEPVSRTRPKLSTRGAREATSAQAQSSALATDEPPSPRPRFTTRRNPSPARSSYTREPSPTRSVAPTQSEPGRSRLWQELRQIRFMTPCLYVPLDPTRSIILLD
ncbi:hypothetical protein BU15DRAFT_85063 [Melanogaster broomeanus]|nr:hypothetical protein BU15DRAFT_85063 [Melanogaster broomeanus]